MSNEEVLTIAGVDYDVSLLPTEIKDLIESFNLANKKLEKARGNIKVFEVACASYAALIKRKIDDLQRDNAVL